MSELTPRLNLYKPADDGSEPVNVATDLNDNLEILDASIGAIPATTTTPPVTVFDGMLRQNTDDESLYYRRGSTWTQILAKGAAFAGNLLLTLGNRIGIGTTTPGAILDVVVSNAADLILRFKSATDTQPRVVLDQTGLFIGPGGTTAADVVLHRVEAGTLNIEADVAISGDLEIGGTPTFGGGIAVDGTLDVDGLTHLAGGLTLEGTSTLNNFPILSGQAGVATVPVNNATSNGTHLTTVSFGRTYPIPPAVFVSLNNGAGATVGFTARPLNITTTNFQIFLTGGTSAVTFSTPVPWLAIKI